MKLADLKTVIRSVIGDVQFVSIYDYETNTVLTDSCSAEYAYCEYGDREVYRITAQGYHIVIELRGKEVTHD